MANDAVAAAQCLSEEMRHFNHLTLTPSTSMGPVSDFYDATAALRTLAGRLPQGIEQLGTWLQRQAQQGRIGTDSTTSHPAQEHVDAAVAALASAHDACAQLQTALATAQAAARPLCTVTEEEQAAQAYIRSRFVPPLPPAYGPWLVELVSMAAEGYDASAEVQVPRAVLDSGLVPGRAQRKGEGEYVMTLREALGSLKMGHLLDD